MNHDQGTTGQRPDAGTADHHHAAPAATQPPQAAQTAADRAAIDQFLAPLWDHLRGRA